MSIPIFMYHQIEERNVPEARENYWDYRYTLPVNQFKTQLEMIQAKSYKTYTLDEWLNGSPKMCIGKAVLLTFDDGWESDYKIVFPMLKKHGETATFFPTVGKIGTPGYVTWGQLREMCENGMSVGSHTMTHRFLSDLAEDDIRWELETSKNLLEERLGLPIKHLSLPGGRSHPKIQSIGNVLGYRTICTSKFGVSIQGDNPFALKRLIMKRSIDIKQFDDFLEQRWLPLLSEKVKTIVKDKMKMILGNFLYLRFRTLAGKFRTSLSGNGKDQ